jgi:hypothetical protein
MNLALDTAAALGAEGPERDEMVSVAMCVGQWLADEGRPGRWDTVDPRAVLEAMSPPSPAEADGILLAMVGLVGQAAFLEQIPRSDACRMLTEIGGLSGNPILVGLTATTVAQLQPPLA